MDQNEMDYLEIDLKEIILKLWNKKFIILGVSIIFGILAFLISSFLIKPKYKSTTSVYIINQNDLGDATLTTQDFQIGLFLVNDYKEIILSNTVMEKAIDTNDLEITPRELSEKITIDSPKDTRIVSISVTDIDPKIATDLADSVREAAIEEIARITKIEDVTTIDTARFPLKPISSPNKLKNTVVSFVLGGFLTSAIIVLFIMIDDKVRKPEDVEEKLELILLSVIPKRNERSK